MIQPYTLPYWSIWSSFTTRLVDGVILFQRIRPGRYSSRNASPPHSINYPIGIRSQQDSWGRNSPPSINYPIAIRSQQEDLGI